MVESTLQQIQAMGAEKAVKALYSDNDALTAANTSAEVVMQLYWQMKDLSACVAAGRAAIESGLKAAEYGESQAEEVRRVVKGIAYNVGSFTWPGWGEPGIVVGNDELAAGLEAAELNLRLAAELERGPLPESRAWWLVGAHRLARRDYAGAREAFAKADKRARTAGVQGEAILAEAYGRLADVLDPHGPSGAEQRLEDTLSRLSRVPVDGADFVEQVQTARRVFQ